MAETESEFMDVMMDQADVAKFKMCDAKKKKKMKSQRSRYQTDRSANPQKLAVFT
jgi:hypothetical protein